MRNEFSLWMLRLHSENQRSGRVERFEHLVKVGSYHAVVGSDFVQARGDYYVRTWCYMEKASSSKASLESMQTSTRSDAASCAARARLSLR